MTAEDIIEIAHEEAITQNASIPTEILEIFESLCCNDKIIFKSQQIDDPELTNAEKQRIAVEVYNRNRETFLLRFGNFLNENQLHTFEAHGLAASVHDAENLEEMQLLINDYRQRLKTRRLSVKNRRYAAMQQLIEKGEYFSEHEMMQRAPELYQELIGQYLSEAEKRQRDGYDVRNTTISGILMHSLERQQRDECLEQVAQDNSQQDTVAIRALVPTTTVDIEVPSNYRQQWGGFDDEPVKCSESVERIKIKENKSCINYKTPAIINLITADERELLRQEFIGQMHEQFLAGEDKDFDYSTVDDNAQYDDLQQINQDQEDAYFDESDEHSSSVEKFTENSKDVSESEDELDVYMKHLSQHHSLQQ